MRTLVFLILMALSPFVYAQNREDIDPADVESGAIFDDRKMLEGYAQRFSDMPQDVLLAIIADDAINSYKSAAAVRVFKVNFAHEILAKEKPAIIKILWHRLNRTDSVFTQIEIMHTLIVLDRYQYFESMIQGLILKLDHYNQVASDLAYLDLIDITKPSTRTREARIVFNTLRKMMFLSRNYLAKVDEPDAKLRHKIDLLRWAIKILGTQELKRLPQEVIRLL